VASAVLDAEEDPVPRPEGRDGHRLPAADEADGLRVLEERAVRRPVQARAEEDEGPPLDLHAAHDGPTRPPRRAALASRGALEFSCGLNCSYEGEAFNGGDGCATRVRGITRLLRADGSELANDEWQLAPQRRIVVGEAFLYGDRCFSLNDVNNMGSDRTEVVWDAASCN